MDFVVGLLKDSVGNTSIVIFIDRLSEVDHLAAVPDSINGGIIALLLIGRVFLQHGMLLAIASDGDLSIHR